MKDIIKQIGSEKIDRIISNDLVKKSKSNHDPKKSDSKKSDSKKSDSKKHSSKSRSKKSEEVGLEKLDELMELSLKIASCDEKKNIEKYKELILTKIKEIKSDNHSSKIPLDEFYKEIEELLRFKCDQ